MCKMNCSEEKKYTLEILILTHSLISALEDWSHLHINCPLWVTCALRDGQVMTWTLPHPDASPLPRNIQWCWGKVKFSVTKLPLCTWPSKSLLYSTKHKIGMDNISCPLFQRCNGLHTSVSSEMENAARNNAMQTAHFPLDGNQRNESSLVLYMGKLKPSWEIAAAHVLYCFK